MRKPVASTEKPEKREGRGLLHPDTPINGEYINILTALLDTHSSTGDGSGRLVNADVAYLLNVPVPMLSALRKGPSSMHVNDRRIRQNSDVPKGAPAQNHKCIRPHHAILIRLLLQHPEYADIIPARPTGFEVYELIQAFMRPAGEPLNEPGPEQRRWFAQHFGRALATSYKMLSNDTTALANRSNSRPVSQLHTLIMMRFAAEFREILGRFRDLYMTPDQAQNALTQPESQGWEILRERDSLTDWMPDDVYAQFQDQLYSRWCDWWDNRYMKTLANEARSRDVSLGEVLKEGSWGNHDPVQSLKGYPPEAAPITGEDGSLLTSFRQLNGLGSSEFAWVLGISPKTMHMYRQRPELRIDPSVSILMRHLYQNPSDLNLLIHRPGSPRALYEKIKVIDPTFERGHLGILVGSSAAAGHSMTSPDAEVKPIAHRAITLLEKHLKVSDDIYWHMRAATEAEAFARGIDPKALWEGARWHPQSMDDDQNDQDPDDDE